MQILAWFSLKRVLTDYQPPAWRFCRRLLPYLGSVYILWLLLRQIGLRPVWDLLVQVDGRWLLVGFGWYFFTNICRAYRFGTLLSMPGMREPLHLVPDMIILSFLNNVLPARVGELLFPFILQQRHRVPIGKSLALLLVARLFDFLAVATLFLVFSFLVRSQLTAMAQQVILAAISVMAPSLFLLASLPWLGQKGLALFDWFLHGLGLNDTRLGKQLRQFGARVVTALSQVHHKRTVTIQV